ncbi:hypothetical protein GCM10027074_77370 [Streptomyces deserti]
MQHGPSAGAVPVPRWLGAEVPKEIPGAARVVVADGGAHPHQPGRGEPGFQDETEPSGAVGGPDPHREALGLHRVEGEEGRPVRALPVPGQARPPGPSRAVLGQQGDARYGVVKSRDCRHGDGLGQLRQLLLGEVAEVGAPGEHRGRPWTSVRRSCPATSWTGEPF